MSTPPSRRVSTLSICPPGGIRPGQASRAIRLSPPSARWCQIDSSPELSRVVQSSDRPEAVMKLPASSRLDGSPAPERPRSPAPRPRSGSSQRTSRTPPEIPAVSSAVPPFGRSISSACGSAMWRRLRA